MREDREGGRREREGGKREGGRREEREGGREGGERRERGGERRRERGRNQERERERERERESEGEGGVRKVIVVEGMHLSGLPSSFISLPSSSSIQNIDAIGPGSARPVVSSSI